MSDEKQSPKSPLFDENLNTQQDEESIYSMDVENANLHTFDVLSSNNPTCDIALSQLALQFIENPTSTPKSEGDQIAALESTSDQMAQLKKAAEGVLVPEIDPKGDSEIAANPKGDSEIAANPKGDSESAANPKGDSEIDMDQIAASESENLSVASGSLSQVSLWDEASLALPEPPRIDIINGLVREHFPALFAEGNRLRDIFGITNVPDNILIELQHKCLFILYQNRVHREGDNVDILLSGALIMELKHLYALGLIRDLVMEGDITDFATLYPAAGQEDKMVCAALILGFTLLAFADYTQTGRERRLKELIEKCRATGVPLPHEHQAQPDHPLTNWLQCVSASLHELKLYVQALKDAINCFSTNNIESTTQEGRLL